MNRYKIRDLTTGQINFQFDSESLGEPKPYWGTPEHQEMQLDPSGSPVLNTDGTPVMVTVPCSYEVLVTDVSYEYALHECWVNRAREYPPIGDQLDARFKAEYLNDRTQLDQILGQIAAVKAKYPKPVTPA